MTERPRLFKLDFGPDRIDRDGKECIDGMVAIILPNLSAWFDFDRPLEYK